MSINIKNTVSKPVLGMAVKDFLENDIKSGLEKLKSHGLDEKQLEKVKGVVNKCNLSSVTAKTLEKRLLGVLNEKSKEASPNEPLRLRDHSLSPSLTMAEVPQELIREICACCTFNGQITAESIKAWGCLALTNKRFYYHIVEKDCMSSMSLKINKKSFERICSILCPKMTIMDLQKMGITTVEDAPFPSLFKLTKVYQNLTHHLGCDAHFTLLSIPKDYLLFTVIEGAREKGIRVIGFSGVKLRDYYQIEMSFFNAIYNSPQTTYRVLISNDVAPNTCSQEYDRQVEVVSSLGCRLPTAYEMVCLCVFTRIIDGKFLFGNIYGRTQSLGGSRQCTYPIMVGEFAPFVPADDGIPLIDELCMTRNYYCGNSNCGAAVAITLSEEKS